VKLQGDADDVMKRTGNTLPDLKTKVTAISEVDGQLRREKVQVYFNNDDNVNMKRGFVYNNRQVFRNATVEDKMQIEKVRKRISDSVEEQKQATYLK
jgi:ABC-type branched-subunit amino acid transport system ATPase component